MLIRCPLHSDETASCSINAEKGLYMCFGCGARGDLFSLAVLSGHDVQTAVQMAFGEDSASFAGLERARGVRPHVPPALQAPTDKAAGWLRKRGIEINERGQITNIDAGRLPHFEEGEMVLGITAWCAVIREDEQSHPTLAWEQWCYYRVMRKRKDFGKYYSTPGFPRGRVLGVAGDRDGRGVIYVGEGVLDALALLVGQSQKGIPRGTAYYTFGANVTRDQAILLETLKGDRTLVLAFDNDEEGMDATFALLRVFPDAQVLCYTGKDPGEGLVGPEPWTTMGGMEWLAGRTK